MTNSSTLVVSLLELLGGDEQVRVVLREAAHAGEAVQRARQLVAVHRAVLGEPHRQVAVAARALLVDQDVHRAVHRLQVVVDARAW